MIGQVVWRRQGLALAIGAASGALAALIGLPLPWLIGAMLGNTAAALLAAPIAAPVRLRNIMVPVIGVMLGSGVTPEILARAAEFGPALLILLPFLFATGAAAYVVFRRIGGYDPLTAYFAAAPGGLNDMMLIAESLGADARRVALAHATRILTVITFVVLFYGFVLGVRSEDSAEARHVALAALSLPDWLILIFCAAVGAVFGKAAKLPAPNLLGPLILSGIAHGTGLTHAAPPTLLIVVAQVVIGTVVGCRFSGLRPREIGRDIALGAAASAAMVVSAIGFALVLTRITGDDLSLSFLALSPGGLTEMSLLALAMGQDVIYVSLIHIVRISLVIAFAEPVRRLIKRARRAG